MTARALRAFRDGDGTLLDHVGALHVADFLIFQRVERDARAAAAADTPKRGRRRR